jgi:hypothetical protein
MSQYDIIPHEAQELLQQVDKTPYGIPQWPQLSRGQHVSIAYAMGSIEKALPLWRGDHALEVSRLFGVLDSEMIKELAVLYGISVDRLRNEVTTAKRWTQEERQHWIEEGLSPSHLELLNAIKLQQPDEAEYWLTEAAVNKWSVAKLSHMLSGRPQVEQQSLMMALHSHQWDWSQIVAHDSGFRVRNGTHVLECEVKSFEVRDEEREEMDDLMDAASGCF